MDTNKMRELKALAEAATQSHGAWRVEVDHNGVHVIGDGSWKILSAWHTPDGKGAQNAEFAAAASPATVLALLAEIDQLKAENEAMRKIISESSAACGAAVSVECSLEFMANLPSEIGAVLAALRKDAERYRYMRRAWAPHLSQDEADAQTDAAMVKEANHG
ncbi:Uncharacterised protein [Pseudomonas putida]|nr:Uncharacterised protein [Pseudomonas putida]CAB5577934.1 Uncharacterised protein [Pseudomonas putida]CAB5621328.1 Uncharacterised protein [Pseudomonas putida]CAB5622858.1 Uncharacterised protein [Pseudomonas putida]CAB5702177.1 Uncharacterised protein [Pseudomonas putida]